MVIYIFCGECSKILFCWGI